MRDEAWLRWIARFRFVTAKALAERFDVTWGKANRRVVRLVDAGLVVRVPGGGFGAPLTVHLSARGAAALRLPRRKVPRALDASRVGHEIAIASYVVAFELALQRRGALGRARLLTERDCRQAEAQGTGEFSVSVYGQGGLVKRWPDAVYVPGPDAKPRAYEIEFAAKPSLRLAQIIRGYRNSPTYAQTSFLVASPALAARLARIIRAEGAATRVSVLPWGGISETERLAVERAAQS